MANDKCPEYLEQLNEYLDGELDTGLCAEIDAFVGECTNCRVMVDSLRQTVRLCRDGTEISLPASVTNRLTELLRRRWEAKFGSPPQ